MPFDDNAVDVVITVHVLHLIPDWKQALAEIRRVLKPDGLYLYRYEKKQYSASWQIPNKIFLRLAQNLRQWAQQRYSALDTPLSRDAKFKLTIAQWLDYFY